MKSKTIRVDNDVLLYLQHKAVYGDSINSVIRRELNLPKGRANVENRKVRIFFLRDERRFPVACIASTIEGDKVRYAVSTHNPKDPYDKAMARHIAEERLAQKKELVNDSRYDRGVKRSAHIVKPVGGTIPVPADIKTTKLNLLATIAAEQHLPQRLRDAALRWIAGANKA